MLNLLNALKKKDKKTLSKDDIAEMLKVSPEALKEFEKSYAKHVLEPNVVPNNLLDMNVHMFKDKNGNAITEESPEVNELINRIVNELLEDTVAYAYDGIKHIQLFPNKSTNPRVTPEDLCNIPYDLRPQLTGDYLKRDVRDDGSTILLEMYQRYKTEENPAKRKLAYQLFRQGLDLQDLDWITYEILGKNPNSIGYWFPELVKAVEKQSFFKLPKTTIIKVPMPLLQLSRLDYAGLTPTTIKIVDQYCHKVFGLDDMKEYFVKTGVFSSKYDFRNAHVHGEKEVQELGEYLLFISHQAVALTFPTNNVCMYGAATTNEWCVREYIPDKENNPCIYKGLPLHTEYRIFVDFDSKEVIGVSPYWEPNTMKQRFGHEEDSDSPHQIHDYIIYQAHEEVLMKRYQDNISRVKEEVENIIRKMNLTGQWSMDIMQNGDDFWIIDMALADNSALSECVPGNLLKKQEMNINWLPDFEEK